jgi:hypothetical protein
MRDMACVGRVRGGLSIRQAVSWFLDVVVANEKARTRGVRAFAIRESGAYQRASRFRAATLSNFSQVKVSYFLPLTVTVPGERPKWPWLEVGE